MYNVQCTVYRYMYMDTIIRIQNEGTDAYYIHVHVLCCARHCLPAITTVAARISPIGKGVACNGSYDIQPACDSGINIRHIVYSHIQSGNVHISSAYSFLRTE